MRKKLKAFLVGYFNQQAFNLFRFNEDVFALLNISSL